MKANLKVQGHIELAESDLHEAFRLIALKKAPDIIHAVSAVIHSKYGYTPTKIQKNEDLTKVTAIIDEVIDQGAQVLGRGPKAPIDRASNAGFTVRWQGFYPAARHIFDELKAKGKHNVGLDDFYSLLLDMDDVKTGGKLFAKNGQTIEKTRVKQYLTPSQLKKTPLMRGIRWDEKNQEFRF